MRQLLTHPRVKGAIIHPLVFAVYPAISLYTHNMGKGHLGEAVGTTVVVFLFAAALWLLLKLLIRDTVRSAIVVSLFFFLLFSYGHAINALGAILEKLQLSEKAGFLIGGESSQLVWLVIWGILFLTVSYLVSRVPGDRRTATGFLNVVALALVAMMIVNFAVGSVNTFLLPRVRAAQDQGEVPSTPHNVGSEVPSTPHNAGSEVPPTPDSVGPVESNSIDGDFRAFLPTVAKGVVDDTDELLAREFASSWQDNLSIVSMNGTSDSMPDIYYIILDMYVRADFLSEIYHIDNSEFLSFLAERGFYVADRARSNYPHTILSLSSSLNLMYLDEIAEQVGERSTSYWPLTAMIKNNKVSQLLRSQGYSTVVFSSGFGPTEIKDADIYMAPSGWRPTEFQNILMESTPLVFLRKTQDEVQRELVLHTFDHLADVAEIDSPTFVFAHIVCPHVPFVFGANGERIRSKSPFDYEYDEFVEIYGNQLKFSTKKIQDTIDEILTKSPTPPIIILQSDHGSNSSFYAREDMNLHFPEHYAILSAYYFPDQDYKALSEDFPPVNTFRVVFNQYFGTDYELLENRSYFSRIWDSPYLFTDVTEKVVDYK